MRFQFFICVACMLAPQSAFADTKEVKSGPPPQWVTPSPLAPVPANANGPVFVRQQDALIHFNEKGQEQYISSRYKILQPSALGIGNISLTWNPAAGNPTVHSIKVYRDRDTIDVLKSTNFEILRREDQMESAILNGMLTAIIRVSDLRVGDELEVSYTIRVNDPTLGNDDAGALLLGPAPAPGRYRLELSWDNGWKPQLKLSQDMLPIAQQSQNAVAFRFDNPVILTPPKDAPLRFQWQRMVEYSDFSDWESISRRFAPLYTKAAGLSANSSLRQEVRRILAANASEMERASAALKLVQQDVRYIYVGLDNGSLTPANAEETWQRRYGDCKAKTVLLLALLGAMGIDAMPVIVNNSGTDDGLDERLPSPRMFDHVLVRARINGNWYWLDGTLPPVVPPSETPTLPYRWVLPLTKEGRSLEKLQRQPAVRPDEISLNEIDARDGFDQPARVVSTSITRGIKGLQQQVQLSGATDNQLIEAFRQNLAGGTWQTITDVKWHYDTKAQASILSISGTWKLDWEDDGNGGRSLALPGGGFSPPERRGRATDQRQDLPYYNKPNFDCNVTTVRLPTTTRSKQWSTNSAYDDRMFGQNYYRSFGLRDGSIRMIRGFRVEREEIDAATARRDNERIAAFDNSMAWISFDPAGQGSPIAPGTNLPATYEIDWTADHVPCLSEAALHRPEEPHITKAAMARKQEENANRWHIESAPIKPGQ